MYNRKVKARGYLGSSGLDNSRVFYIYEESDGIWTYLQIEGHLVCAYIY